VFVICHTASYVAYITLLLYILQNNTLTR
jgi:hypothetical protein